MIEITAKNTRYYNLILKFKPLKNKNGLYIAKKSVISSETIIEKGTRINGQITIKGEGKCHIKKYCAFGSDIKIITSNHIPSYMNLQIALQRKIGVSTACSNEGSVEIGHNVWIGDNVIILPNVRIGNGVIIGAGAIVTKDIPSYAICVGNPAKVIKYRFNNEIIDEIEKLAWWDWSINKMKENIRIFNKEWL